MPGLTWPVGVQHVVPVFPDINAHQVSIIPTMSAQPPPMFTGMDAMDKRTLPNQSG